MSYEPSHPDLSRLWLTAHDQALAMSLGTTEHGEILTTALPEAAPLLILAQSSDAQKRQVLAWLAQLLSKCGRSGLRLALLEQPGDQKLTRLPTGRDRSRAADSPRGRDSTPGSVHSPRPGHEGRRMTI